MEQQYPKGSLLKIKSLTLEFYLKKKGKMEMKVDMFSTEDYKKITS